MANNPKLYNAVIAGITGAYQSRRAGITIDLIAAANVATKVDALIPTDINLKKTHAELMRCTCYGIFSRHSYINLNSRLPTIIAEFFNNVKAFVEPLPPVGQVLPGQVPVASFPAGTAVGQLLFWSPDDNNYIPFDPSENLPLPIGLLASDVPETWIRLRDEHLTIGIGLDTDSVEYTLNPIGIVDDSITQYTPTSRTYQTYNTFFINNGLQLKGQPVVEPWIVIGTGVDDDDPFAALTKFTGGIPQNQGNGRPFILNPEDITPNSPLLKQIRGALFTLDLISQSGF